MDGHNYDPGPPANPGVLCWNTTVHTIERPSSAHCYRVLPLTWSSRSQWVASSIQLRPAPFFSARFESSTRALFFYSIRLGQADPPDALGGLSGYETSSGPRDWCVNIDKALCSVRKLGHHRTRSSMLYQISYHDRLHHSPCPSIPGMMRGAHCHGLKGVEGEGEHCDPAGKNSI